jgi:hypothetical protein
MSEAKRAALLANPRRGDDDEPIQLIGTLGDRVIGRMDVVVGGAHTTTRPVRIAWGSGFHVPEEHRSTLMGVTLLLTMQRLFEAVGAAGPSQLAYPLYKGLRYHDVAMPRYVLLRHSRPVIERFVGPRRGTGAAAVLADLGLIPLRGAVAAWTAVRTRGLRTERTDTVTPELESRMALGPGVLLSFERSKAWLDWVLTHRFHEGQRHRRELHLVRDAAGAVVAYFLVKARHYPRASHHGFPNLYLGSLHDWWVFDEGAVELSQLLLLAVRAVAPWGVHALEVCLPPDAQSLSLRRYGLVRVGEMHVVVRGEPGSPLADAGLADPRVWRVRPGEGDYIFS